MRENWPWLSALGFGPWDDWFFWALCLLRFVFRRLSWWPVPYRGWRGWRPCFSYVVVFFLCCFFLSFSYEGAGALRFGAAPCACFTAKPPKLLPPSGCFSLCCEKKHNIPSTGIFKTNTSYNYITTAVAHLFHDTLLHPTYVLHAYKTPIHTKLTNAVAAPPTYPNHNPSPKQHNPPFTCN